jgi:tetratricopeptide (TPR) repeat protein
MSLLKTSAVIAILLAALPVRAEGTSEAKAHFEKGQTHYSLGEFDEAAAEFKEAFRLRQEPAILYNIAQAMRQSHQYQQAYFYYSQFLHKRPEAPNRSEVEGLMAQMKQKMEEKEEYEKGHPTATLDDDGKKQDAPARQATEAPVRAATTAALQPRPAAPSPAVTTDAPAPAAAPASQLGAGVVAEGAAFAFHSGAQSAADSFNRKYADHSLTAADAQLKSDAQSKGKLATLAAIGGGLLLITGAVLTFAF